MITSYVKAPIKDWIQTWTGVKFRPLSPRAEDINIQDIAHHLSMICRYTGAVDRFYSVAEHSVLVAYRAAQLSSEKDCLMHARWGLLHDASEAYIADVSRPLKHQPAFADYRAAEKKLQGVIALRFGLHPVEPELVKRVDSEMLGTEVVQLMIPLHPDWASSTKEGYLAPPIKLPESMSRLGLPPEAAEALFMNAFRVLFE